MTRETPYRGDLEDILHGNVLWNINKNTNDPNQRALFAQVAAALSPGRQIWSEISFDDQSKQAAAALQQNGFVNLSPLLSGDLANETIQYFTNISEFERDQTLRYFKISDILKAPHLLGIACHPTLWTLIAAYLKTAPTIIDLCAWWSDPRDNVPFGAQIPHRDRDDFRFCKLFVYLTDVGPEDGPHTYLPRSHSLAGMQELCNAHNVDSRLIPQAFDVNSRKQSNWTFENFREAMVEFTGPAGTAFIVNTFGYHFGKVPRKSARFVFQAVYGQMSYNYRAESEVVPLVWTV